MSNEVPAKNVKRVTVYLDPKTYEKLEELAEKDKRSLSNMAAVLLERLINEPKEQ